jgi:hypothetical protein
LSLGPPSLARLQHTAAYVSLLQNHNVKERRFGENYPQARARRTEARQSRAETVPGLGGRRGFYAPALAMSTTFSRKKRISRTLKKSSKKQRDFCGTEHSAHQRERLTVATMLT